MSQRRGSRTLQPSDTIEKRDIQNAIEMGEYEKAEVLLQKYKIEGKLCDDIIAILDAGIGEHYGNRTRVWEAIRRGLIFNSRNYELYVMLGNYYLAENVDQSYLCYENALFYCDDSADAETIRQLLRWLEAEHKVSVRKSAAVLVYSGRLERMMLCITRSFAFE